MRTPAIGVCSRRTNASTWRARCGSFATNCARTSTRSPARSNGIWTTFSSISTTSTIPAKSTIGAWRNKPTIVVQTFPFHTDLGVFFSRLIRKRTHRRVTDQFYEADAKQSKLPSASPKAFRSLDSPKARIARQEAANEEAAQNESADVIFPAKDLSTSIDSIVVVRSLVKLQIHFDFNSIRSFHDVFE